MIPFFIDFSRFWRPLGPQVGPMLRPCWPQNPQKKTLEKKATKRPQKGCAKENGGWILGSLKLTENNPVKAVQGKKTRPRS